MQPYFEKHSLFKVMQALLQAVIKERPADPYAYMVQMLQNSSQSAARRMQSSISSNGHPSTPEAAVFVGCLKSGRRTRGNSHSVAFREEAGVPTAAEAAAGMACGGGTAAAEEAVAVSAAAAAADPTNMDACSSAEGKREPSMTAFSEENTVTSLCLPQYVPSHVSPLPEMLPRMKPAAPVIPSERSCPPPQHNTDVPQLACAAEDYRHIAWTRSLFEEVPLQEPVVSSCGSTAQVQRPFLVPTHIVPSPSAGIARTAGRLPARSQSTPSLNPPSLLPLKGNGRPPRGRALHTILGFQQAEHQRKAETFSGVDDLNSPGLSASTQYTQERILADLSAGPSMMSEDGSSFPVFNSVWREEPQQTWIPRTMK